MKIPLMHDYHSHVSIYSVCRWNINHITKLSDAISLLQKLPNRISVVLGWNSHLYSFPQEELDKLPPVVISRNSLHGFIINAKAKSLLEENYGKFIENCRSMEWLEKHIPEVCQFYGAIQELSLSDVELFFHNRGKEGIYSLEDMLLASEQSLHIICNSKFCKRTKFWVNIDGYKNLSVAAREKIYGIKIFTDGALSSKTAAVYQSFIAGNKGVLVYSDNDLEKLLCEVSPIGKPVALHAIGDRAIDQVIAIIEKLLQQNISFPEVRIEHAQLITPEAAKKAKNLGIILCMQPNFSIDSDAYKDRMPIENCKNNNPFRMLIDEVKYIPGKDLLFGSDGMPHGAKMALEQAFFPPYESQMLSIEEFVAGYCVKDFSLGYINVEIDQDNKEVSVESFIEEDIK